MLTIEKSTLIQAPIEKVFGYLSEPTNLPEVWPSLIEVRNVNRRPHGVGSRYLSVYKIAGTCLEGFTEVTECVPNQRIVLRDRDGGRESVRTTTLEPEGAGTRVTTRIQFNVPVALRGKLAESFIRSAEEHDTDSLLANLKARMEIQ